MAIIDSQNEFSVAQDIAATGFGTNWFDRSTVNGDLGVGTPIDVEFHMGEAAAASGAATVQFEIVEATDNAGSGVESISISPAIPKATLVAGYKHRLSIKAGENTLQFIGVRYTVASGPLTGNGGAISAYVSPVAQDSKHYFGQV